MAARKLSAIVLIALFTLSINAWAAGQYEFLKKYINQYPDDQFFNLPEIHSHLRKLLGPQYKHFRRNMAVVIPMDFIQGNLVASGCQAHNCPPEQAILAVNTNRGALTAGILTDGQQITIFSQETDRFEFLPEAIKKWAEKCQRENGGRPRITIQVQR